MIEYTILSSTEIVSLLRQNTLIYKYQEREYDTYASIYDLPNKKILFVTKRDIGIIFNNESEMYTILKEQGVPLPFDGTNPFENNIERISNLNKENIQSFVDEASSLLKVNLEINGEEKYLLSLSKPINSYLRKTDKMEAHMKLYVPLGIYVGEIIVSLIDNGYWYLHKSYSIKPYWTPYIKSKDHEMIEQWKPILDSFRMRRINLPLCINRANITTPKLFSKCNL